MIVKIGNQYKRLGRLTSLGTRKVINNNALWFDFIYGNENDKSLYLRLYQLLDNVKINIDTVKLNTRKLFDICPQDNIDYPLYFMEETPYIKSAMDFLFDKYISKQHKIDLINLDYQSRLIKQEINRIDKKLKIKWFAPSIYEVDGELTFIDESNISGDIITYSELTDKMTLDYGMKYHNLSEELITNIKDYFFYDKIKDGLKFIKSGLYDIILKKDYNNLNYENIISIITAYVENDANSVTIKKNKIKDINNVIDLLRFDGFIVNETEETIEISGWEE